MMSEQNPQPPEQPGRTRPLVIALGVLVVVLAVLAVALIGYLILNRGGSRDSFPSGAAEPSVRASPSTSTVTVTPSATPTSSTPSTTTPSTTSTTPTSTTVRTPQATATTVAGAPNGSRPCPVKYPPTPLYSASSVGNSVTTCGFAEEIRSAYADTGRPGQLPRAVTAVSPETGERIRMMCAARASIVTCTGGRDALVYIY